MSSRARQWVVYCCAAWTADAHGSPVSMLLLFAPHARAQTALLRTWCSRRCRSRSMGGVGGGGRGAEEPCRSGLGGFEAPAPALGGVDSERHWRPARGSQSWRLCAVGSPKRAWRDRNIGDMTGGRRNLGGLTLDVVKLRARARARVCVSVDFPLFSCEFETGARSMDGSPGRETVIRSVGWEGCRRLKNNPHRELPSSRAPCLIGGGAMSGALPCCGPATSPSRCGARPRPSLSSHRNPLPPSCLEGEVAVDDGCLGGGNCGRDAKGQPTERCGPCAQLPPVALCGQISIIRPIAVGRSGSRNPLPPPASIAPQLCSIIAHACLFLSTQISRHWLPVPSGAGEIVSLRQPGGCHRARGFLRLPGFS